jgi:hypothetical protein
MVAVVVDRQEGKIIVQATIELQGVMLADEEAIQEAVNEVGAAATAEALQQFDTDGGPIRVGDVRLTSKGRSPETYESPYGPVEVPRHVYQSSAGGRTFCPLEANARMVLNATPRFAKMVSYKYASAGADAVVEDLIECNGRRISRGYCKSLSDTVGAMVEAKEETWHYDLPRFDRPVASISVGLDGTCMFLRDDGWREGMAGTIGFYDDEGNRLHTIYTGATPEYGKGRFRKRLGREIERVKECFPDVPYVGLGDGASDNWTFLEQHTDAQVLDFWHASEYIHRAAAAIFGRRTVEKEAWLEDRLHRLKHRRGAAARLLTELESVNLKSISCKAKRADVQAAVRYLTNHRHRMKYAAQVEGNRPIGSGVTEAACKVLIKQRFCKSGSRWKEQGATAVLAVRSLRLTPGRWTAFWTRVSRFGVPSLD